MANGELKFGDLRFPGDAAGVLIEVLGPGSGTNWGTAEDIVDVVESFLQDGATEATQRRGNRELPLRLRLTADDTGALAAAESMLVAECRKCDPVDGSNTLTWTPLDGFGPPSVFEVIGAKLEHDLSDAEIGYGNQTLRRYYNLTLRALPFSKSVDPVVVDIAAADPEVTTEVLDDGSSTTDWAIAPTAGNAVRTFTGSTTWVAPAGVVSVLAEAVGGGGGGSNNGGLLGGGGGGGAYASKTGAVSPGTGYAVTVGGGGAKGSSVGATGGTSQFSSSSFVKAVGGTGASGASGGAGGQASASVGTTRTSGGGGGHSSTVAGHAVGGAGGNGAPPLGSSSVGKGGTGAYDSANATNGIAGRVRLTYDGKWTIAVDATGIKASKPAYGNVASWLERTGLAADMTDKPYLQVKTSLPAGAATLAFKLNGTPATVVSQSGGTYWLDASAIAILDELRIDISSADTNAATLYVLELSATTSLTPGSTGRENARQLPVAGSERTVASLSLSDEASGLGTVLVYTTTEIEALLPALREHLVPGPTITPDGTTVSGSTSDLTTEHDFDLSAANLAAGGYLLLARIQHDVTEARTIDWAAVSRMNGVDVGDLQSGSRTINLVADEWAVVTIAALNLPPTRVGPGGIVRIQLSGDVILDNAWLFDVEHGRLTQVDCGASKRLWLDVASVDEPAPSLWRGDNEDRSDAIHAGSDTQAWGVHEFVPPAVSVFTVTTDSTAAALILQHYPRWHTHAGG